MNYRKLLDRLENETSIEELEKYLSGERKLDRRIGTIKQKTEILEKIIPRLIKNMRKDNEKITEAWIKSPLLRLGFVRCQQKKNELQEIKLDDHEDLKQYKYTRNFYFITEAMREIINQMGQDKSKITKQRFAEYSHHVKAGHYETDSI
jgi:hypothetical protein